MSIIYNSIITTFQYYRYEKKTFRALLILFSLSLFSVYATDTYSSPREVDKAEVLLVKQNGSTRSNNEIIVSAFTDNVSNLEIKVENYSGIVSVKIQGGRTSTTRNVYADEWLPAYIDISNLRNAAYNVTITIEDNIFEGTLIVDAPSGR